MQNFSGLNNYLVDLLRGFLIGNLFPALYADGIFASLATILPRFRNPDEVQRLLNIRLASLREVIEHVFAQHRNKFRVFDTPQYLRLFNRGVQMRKMFMVSFFMMNCFNCINGGACEFFGCFPPTLDVYIPLNEELHPPPAVQLGRLWNYGRSGTEYN